MTIINLKEMYSNYYIREWKKKGLPLITERPPTTTDVLLDRFFSEISTKRKCKRKAIAKTTELRNKKKSKLDWRDYLEEGYKWESIG